MRILIKIFKDLNFEINLGDKIGIMGSQVQVNPL